MALEHDRGLLTVHFEVSFKLKFSYPKKKLPNYEVTSNNCTLGSLYEHIKQYLNLGNDSSVYSVLPIAVCSSDTISDPTSTKVPLVAEELWKNLISTYKYSVLKVVLEKRPLIDLSTPLSGSFFQKTLKSLDVRYYIPEVLDRGSIISLGELIFHKDYHIKSGLRRGLWMHLLGVFHPALKSLEQREEYIIQLRRMYDILKGKWIGDGVSWTPTIQHLYDSIQRDAIRTDPTQTFMAGTIGNAIDDNLQKLVEVIMIFVLEHSNIKYTQGMTDLLSPLLYVMEREDDAYICFAAMMEHIKDNFTEWCEGTLNKLERLKHVCEVLDPQLYNHLTRNMVDDPFVLFFGMILIECRREFSFQDSLHLFEVLWSSTIKNDSPSLEVTSLAEWAWFMTNVSHDMVLQLFGETPTPYATHPLDESISDVGGDRRRSSNTSSVTSQARLIPRPGSASMRSGNLSHEDDLVVPCSPFSSVPLHNGQVVGVDHHHDNRDHYHDDQDHHHDDQDHRHDNHHDNQVVGVDHQSTRSASLPDSTYVILSHSELSGARSEGDLGGRGEEGDNSEGGDGVGELNSSTVVRRINTLSHTTEMSDMSSVSSTSNGLLTSLKSADNSPVVPKKHGKKTTPKLPRHHKQNGFIDHAYGPPLPPDGCHEDSCSHDDCVFEADEDSTLMPDSSSATTTMENTPPVVTQATAHTPLYKPGTNHYYASTMPRHTPADSNASSSLPNDYLRRLSVPSVSSPYVSAIRPLDSIGMSLGSTHYHEATPTSLYQSPEHAIRRNTVLHEEEASSLENSVEMSHVLSQLANVARPDVSRESSLRIKMANSFSIFVCLAILVKSRADIMEQDVDFVGLSVLLNNQTGSQNLSHVLKIARQLHKCYRQYQDLLSAYKPHLNNSDVYETWLDDLTTPTATNSGIIDSSYGVN